MTQTGTPNTVTNLTYYQNITTNSTLGTSMTFGDATITNPAVSLSLSSSSIASNGGSSTLTVATFAKDAGCGQCGRSKSAVAAPYADYTLIGPAARCR